MFLGVYTNVSPCRSPASFLNLEYWNCENSDSALPTRCWGQTMQECHPIVTRATIASWVLARVARVPLLDKTAQPAQSSFQVLPSECSSPFSVQLFCQLLFSALLGLPLLLSLLFFPFPFDFPCPAPLFSASTSIGSSFFVLFLLSLICIDYFVLLQASSLSYNSWTPSSSLGNISVLQAPWHQPEHCRHKAVV